MDRRNNPYAPGAGLQPPELAGRDRLIEDVTIDMDRVLARRPTKGLVLRGLRGVGKTVLLNRLGVGLKLTSQAARPYADSIPSSGTDTSVR